MRTLWQARMFPNKPMTQVSLKSVWKHYSKKTKRSQFFRKRCIFMVCRQSIRGQTCRLCTPLPQMCQLWHPTCKMFALSNLNVNK